MSNRSMRRVLAGVALAATLFLGSARLAAAAPMEAASTFDVWRAVQEWVMSLWGGAAAGPEKEEPGSTSGAEVVCGWDEGPCIDPNG